MMSSSTTLFALQTGDVTAPSCFTVSLSFQLYTVNCSRFSESACYFYPCACLDYISSNFKKCLHLLTF